MRYWIYMVVLIALLGSCRKEEALPVEPAYVPGQLIVVMDSGRTMESTLALFNALSLPLMEVHGFHLVSPRPVEEVRRVLGAKSYIRPQALLLKPDSATGRTVISATFYHLDLPQQHDWAQTRTELGAEEKATPAIMKWVLVKVPDRSEKSWIGVLARQPGVKYAEYNHKAASF